MAPSRCSPLLLVSLAALALPALGTKEKTEQIGVMLFEEMHNVTELNYGTCFRYPAGQECSALCRRIGFRQGRCHKRECFCTGQHCIEGPVRTSLAPPGTPTASRHPTRHRSTRPTGFVWTTEATTDTPQCPHDVNSMLCNMGCSHFCTPLTPTEMPVKTKDLKDDEPVPQS